MLCVPFCCKSQCGRVNWGAHSLLGGPSEDQTLSEVFVVISSLQAAVLRDRGGTDEGSQHSSWECHSQPVIFLPRPWGFLAGSRSCHGPELTLTPCSPCPPALPAGRDWTSGFLPLSLAGSSPDGHLGHRSEFFLSPAQLSPWLLQAPHLCILPYHTITPSGCPLHPRPL